MTDMTVPPAGALEACPFCGGEAELRGKTQQRYVACLTNHCVDGPYGDFDDDAAIAAWNRRTHGPALLAALRLREECQRLEQRWRDRENFDCYVRSDEQFSGVLRGRDICADDLARVLEQTK